MPITILEKENTDRGPELVNAATGARFPMVEGLQQIRPLLSNIRTLCLNKVTTGYGQDSILAADVIVLSRDDKGALRGFAALLLTPAEGKVYIDLICNAKPPTVGTRSNNRFPSGRDLLDAIKTYTVTKGYRYIELKALEHVISYYYRFGWRFISKCGAKENPVRSAQVQQLLNVLRAAGDPDKYTEEEEARVSAALQPFRGYQKGRFSERKAAATAAAMAATARSGDANREELLDEHTATRDKLQEQLREDGYTMIWCANDPDGATAAAPSRSDGGGLGGGHKRGRKRRTKKRRRNKKNQKKTTMKKRRKKKRQTRRRRKYKRRRTHKRKRR